MCIGFATGGFGREVSLTDTLGAAWVGTHEGRKLHFMAYQNSIGLQQGIPKSGYDSLRGPSGWDKYRIATQAKSGGAAMLIAVPVRAGGFYKFFDSSGMPGFLSEMLAPADDPTAKGFSMDWLRGGESRIEVVTHGVYTSVLFQNADPEQVAKVVTAQVPVARRPEVNLRQLEWFGRAYPSDEWAGVLACADPAEVGAGRRADPFVVGFETSYPGALVFPAVEEHDTEKLPSFSGLVLREHRVGFYVPNGMISKPATYSRVSGELGKVVPPGVWVWKMNAQTVNGDFVVPIESLYQNRPEVKILPPPGLEA